MLFRDENNFYSAGFRNLYSVENPTGYIIMVEFSSDDEWTLLDHVNMRDELATLSGRSIDLLTKKSIERSHNQTRKEEILRTAKAIYDSAA